MTRAPVDSPEWLTYRDPHRHLDQRANLLGDISRLLPGHQSYFAAATRGTLEDAEGRSVASEHGLAVWVARSLAVTGVVQRFVHGEFRGDGWGAEPVPRTFQALRVVDPGPGQVTVIGHFHGLRDPAGKGDTPARLAQAEMVVRALGELRQPGDRAVLAGDFNILPDSAAFDTFTSAGLSDLVTGRGFTDTRTSFYAKPQRFADYCLVSSDVDVRGFDVPACPELSDHRPLILDLR